jgi:hypothetical protein
MQQEVDANASTNAANQQPPSQRPQGQTLTWWQWIFVYPTLAIAVINSLPNLVFWSRIPPALRNNISVSDVNIARQQKELFVKNEDCFASDEFNYVSEIGETTASIKLCPSGDVLVKFSNPDANPVFQFASFDTTQRSALDRFLVPSVAAATASSEIQLAQVECPPKIEDGRLTRRIREADGKCYEQVINTFTGEVISRTEVSCDASCG